MWVARGNTPHPNFGRIKNRCISFHFIRSLKNYENNFKKGKNEEELVERGRT